MPQSVILNHHINVKCFFLFVVVLLLILIFMLDAYHFIYSLILEMKFYYGIEIIVFDLYFDHYYPGKMEGVLA